MHPAYIIFQDAFRSRFILSLLEPLREEDDCWDEVTFTNFEGCVSAVKLLIGPKYMGPCVSDSRMSEMAQDFARDIRGHIALLQQHAEIATSNDDRRRALDALIDIGNLIFRSQDDDHSNEVRRHLENEHTVPELILAVVKSIPENDRKDLESAAGSIWRLEVLMAAARRHGVTVYDRLDQAIDMFY